MLGLGRRLRCDALERACGTTWRSFHRLVWRERQHGPYALRPRARRRRYLSEPALRGRQVTIVEKDCPATAISLGFPIDVLRGTQDWYALALANSWLGQHRNQNGHLYQLIREARGLNYGDYTYLEQFPDAARQFVPPVNVCRRQQIFEMWIRPVPNAARHFALRAALREFQQLVDHGMTQEQFDETRQFLRKFVLHLAPTTMDRLGYAIDDRFYGIDGSHLEKFRRAMDDLTLAEVNAAIAQAPAIREPSDRVRHQGRAIPEGRPGGRRPQPDHVPHAEARRRCWPRTARSASFR